MKVLALAALLLVAGCGSPAPAATPASTTWVTPTFEDETPAVRATFDAYAKATLAKDGIEAESLLAETVGGYFEAARTMALTGTAEQVAALPVGQRMTVYALRGNLEAAVLRGSTAADVVRASYAKGIIVANNVDGLALGEVTITGGTAIGLVGAPDPYEMPFRREQGVWRIDLAPMLADVDRSMAGFAQRMGITVDALLDRTLVERYGEEKALLVKQPLDG